MMAISMIPLWQVLIAIVLAMLCAGLLTWGLMLLRGPSHVQVDRRLRGVANSLGRGGQLGDSLIRTAPVSPLLGRLAALGKPLDTVEKQDRLTLKLAQAGIRQGGGVKIFLGLKMILMVGGGLGGLAYAISGRLAAFDFLAACALGSLVGFYAPHVWLIFAARRRSERISLALPDSMDMLVIAVEAGLGLDAAIQRVGDEMERTYPELAEEWTMASREAQMGVPRAEALRRMAQRCNLPEMKSLVTTIAQAERFGTSVAQTLRVHDDAMRVKRRQRAEEQAGKMAVKLLFPLIFFIFPALFVVILGPAVVKWIEVGGI